MFTSFIKSYEEQQLGQLLENEPLKKHTTFRVGGPAKVFVIPNSKDSLIKTMELIKHYQLNAKVIGKGSNLLPSDQEFKGVVVKCDKGLDYVKAEGKIVTAGAGVSTVSLANKVAKLGLSGLEFVSGVPGTIGGAVYMNAGAYNKEMQNVLIKALIIDELGQLRWLNNEDFHFDYRTSIMQYHKEWIIVEAVLELEDGNYQDIMDLMKMRKLRRRKSQPLNMSSAGSTFRNPLPHASWKLIEGAGLRGTSIGGAEVSEKHCNFIVNKGDATATDILELIRYVQKVVFENYEIELHLEVEMFNW